MSLSKSDAKNSDVFCMMPWLSIHMWPNGNTFACCMMDMNDELGNVKNNTFREIWNSDKLKKMRESMMNGKHVSECKRCYDLERNGTFTLRQHSINQYLDKHFHDVMDFTDNDGTYNKFDLKHIDIRFSNICNFKCRSCGPGLSSSWHEDQVKLYGHNEQKFIKPFQDENKIWEQIEDIIPNLEEVYFAGGEPLLMEQHYKILEKLIEHGKSDVNIIYNTNLSTLKYKKYDVIEMWKNFNNVKIGASLDDMNERAELIRKGTDWNKILENCYRIKDECPHIHFFISCTVSVLNVFNVPRFHREMLNRELISPWRFVTNILMHPEELRCQIFPQETKEELTDIYDEHIEYLKNNYDDLKDIVKKFEGVKNFINEEDKTNLIPDFMERNKKLDSIRQENMFETLPELKVLLD